MLVILNGLLIVLDLFIVEQLNILRRSLSGQGIVELIDKPAPHEALIFCSVVSLELINELVIFLELLAYLSFLSSLLFDLAKCISFL